MNESPSAYDQALSLHAYRDRLRIALLVIALGGCLLLVRFFWLQVIRYNHYQTLAEANRITLSPIVPSRGIILDRDGIALANNYSAYTLEIHPGEVDDIDDTIEQLSKVIEITPRDRHRFNKLLDESHSFESLPIRNRLTEVEVARFAVNRYRFPGVDIHARLFRSYPLGNTAAHLIGYIGRINDRDLEKLEDLNLLSNYRGSGYLGKVGLEQSYEQELHGQTGFEQMETDAGGHAVNSLARREPVAGNDLILSIDIGLQKAAETAFGQRRGALVALDPDTGDVLAFVSMPGFDPNLFVDGIDQANWDTLNHSADKPLNNRASRGLYPPGSTIKPFLALAALSYDKRRTDFVISDPGYFAFPGSNHHYRDWRPEGHGMVDMRRSIAQSCDTYYYMLANDLGIDLMHDFLSDFGLGQKSGLDIDGELPGVLPSREWKKNHLHQDWYGGETVITGIGQGYNQMTPLQMALATATLANGGKLYKPHLVKKIRVSRSGLVREIAPELVRTLNLREKDVAFIQDAMADVLKPGGTAAVAGAGAKYTIAGKTGTAQVVGIKQNEKYVESHVQERHRDHAWFIGFAPVEHPKIALAVLVENGGHGGTTAAPIARQVMDYWLIGKKQNNPAEELEDKSVPAEANDEEHHGD